MARALQFRDQFRVGISRLLVLRLSLTLPFRKVYIDFVLIPQVKCERAVQLFESQSRIAFHHALGRHPLAEQVHEGIEKTRVSPTRYAPSIALTYSVCIVVA